ncbi:hypothetical protein ABPG77_001850 [Micractinium sp. CCAP 211/92]
MEGAVRKTAIRRRKRTKAGRYVDELTREELATHFGLPAQQAAAAVGVSFTIFKRICRNFGLERWPYRRLKALGLAGDPPAAPPARGQPTLPAATLLPMPELPPQQPSFLQASSAVSYPEAAAGVADKALAEAAVHGGAAEAAAAQAMPALAAAPSAGMHELQTLASSDMRASGLSCNTSANLGGRPSLPAEMALSAALADDQARCASVRSGLCYLAEVAMDADVGKPEAAGPQGKVAAGSRQQDEQEEMRPASPWQAELARQAQQAKQAHDAAAQGRQPQKQQEALKQPSIRMLLCAATAAAHAGRELELQALLRILISEIDRRLLQPEDELQRDALLRLRHAAQERLGQAETPADGGAAAGVEAQVPQQSAAGAEAQAPQQSAAQQPAQPARPARSEEEGFGFEISLALPVPQQQAQQAQRAQQAQQLTQQADPVLEFPQRQQDLPQLEFPRLPRLRLPFAAALIQAAVHLPSLQAAAAAAAAAVSEPALLNHVQPSPPAQHNPTRLVQQLLQSRPLTPAESHGSAINRFGPAAGEDASPHTCDSTTGRSAFGAWAPAPRTQQPQAVAPIRPCPVPPQTFSALAELVAIPHPSDVSVPRRLATARVEMQRLKAASTSPCPSATGF